MTVAPLAMHAAAGQVRVPHAESHHAAPDSASVDDLASVHAASACIDTGELATTSRAPAPPLVASAALPVEMRWDVHPGDLRRAIYPEPPPPDATVRRALLQVFLN